MRLPGAPMSIPVGQVGRSVVDLKGALEGSLEAGDFEPEQQGTILSTVFKEGAVDPFLTEL